MYVESILNHELPILFIFRFGENVQNDEPSVYITRDFLEGV